MSVLLTKSPAVSFLKTQAKAATKRVGLGNQLSQVIFVVDVSGSTEFPENRFFSSGIMDAAVRRVGALGFEMDDDGVVPVIALDHQARVVPEALTEDNIDGYVAEHLTPYVGGGTAYAPSINRALDIVQTGGAPALVVFFTDGNSSDVTAAKQALVSARPYPVFFQFFGVQRKPAPQSQWDSLFPALAELNNLGGGIDNCGFAVLGTDDSALTDPELFRLLLNEYPDYLNKVRASMLPWDVNNDPHNRPGSSPTVAQPSRPQRRGLFGRR